MSSVQPFTLINGDIVFVEVDDSTQSEESIAEFSKSLSSAPPSDSLGLPEGAEFTSTSDDLIIGGKLLQESILNMATTANDSLKKLAPDEWSIELHYGFKGKAAIPVILSGENQGGIKVTAKWVKKQS